MPERFPNGQFMPRDWHTVASRCVSSAAGSRRYLYVRFPDGRTYRYRMPRREVARPVVSLLDQLSAEPTASAGKWLNAHVFRDKSLRCERVA